MFRCVLLCILLFLSTSNLASANGAGIVDGLWYADDPLLADEATRIYIAVRNNTGTDFSGVITFFINGEQLSQRDIEALDGRVVESWADWTPAYGTSTVRATLTRNTPTVGDTTTTTISSDLAEDVVFVDRDTDGDGIPDQIDTDDDGDGIPDHVELENGTDPLVPNPSPDTEEQTTNSSAAGAATSSPRGLEQFLRESRVESALADITDYLIDIKASLDRYRAERHNDTSPTVTTTSSTDTDTNVTSSGFGTITRSYNDSGGGIGATLAALVSGLYSIVLTMLSWLLGHPILLQIAFLIGLLYLIMTVARKLGARKSG